ncbi:3-hydroxy-9,10-secoandrosta-1,3,5(10)-triene-9,17-dione monooxygenase oxygenase subunit [Streptomyces sp. NPDC046931]|uniref:3-hydroxy-9,10-secoandrosta-1,3,5(10)-triene-9, 17-dione monooxygenase oxygenase subunit n=1 Tax=Streptomyces sp. NPDC046931 TaxID=3154806 RepID=UPI0033DB3419
MNTKEILDAARKLAPSVRARAADAENMRRLPDETVKELTDAGVFRLTQPSAHGGFSADPADFYEVLRQLGDACCSTGWCCGVFGVSAWLVAQYDPRAQAEVWGTNHDALVCFVQAPMGQAENAEGGFRVSGRWSYASGCDHADWALLGARVDGGGGLFEWRCFLLPRSDYRVHAEWDSVGLRGTGSSDITVEDAFVPNHRSLSMEQLSASVRPGHDANLEPLYRLPMGSVLTTSISAPLVGAAEAACRCYLASTRERIRGSSNSRTAEDPFVHVRLGRAASEIDAAWLQLMRNIQDLYEYARRGETPPMALRTRLRRDQVRATERVVYAVDLLMDHAGAGATRAGDNVLQRAWRDIHTGRGHVANDPERSLTLFGSEVLGLPVHDPML